MRIWQAHEKAIRGLAFAGDGGALATAGDDDPVARVRDLAAGAERHGLTMFQETALSLAFAPDGRTLAVGRPWAIELWDTVTGEQRARLHAHKHHSASLAFATYGRRFLSAGLRLSDAHLDSVQAHFWDLASGQIVAEHVEPIRDRFGLALALDGHTLFWAANDGGPAGPDTATLTHVPTGQRRAVLAVPGPAHTAALAPGGRVLAAAVRGDVYLWAVEDESESSPEPAASPPALLRWFGRDDPPAEPPGLAPRLALPGATERIDAVAFTPDGGRLLVGSAVGSVRAWDVPDLPPPPLTDAEDETDVPAKVRVTTRPARAFDWGIGPVTALAVAPDGLTAAAGSHAGQVVVWDLDF